MVKDRGKDKLTCDWVYGDKVEGENRVWIVKSICRDDGMPEQQFADVIPETVGMGVEIDGKWWFEGDIFNLGDPNIKYQVVWNDIAIMGKQIGSSSYIGLSFWNKIMTLVGNKWDNPELLGGQNEPRD